VTLPTPAAVLRRLQLLLQLMKGVGAADASSKLLDRPPRIKQTVGRKVTSAAGALRFDNVNSRTDRPGRAIFHGLSFEIPGGSNVCVVGPSGGGKSTVASLLLRFYEPSAGTITVGGVDIADVNVKSLRRRDRHESPRSRALVSAPVADSVRPVQQRASPRVLCRMRLVDRRWPQSAACLSGHDSAAPGARPDSVVEASARVDESAVRPCTRSSRASGFARSLLGRRGSGTRWQTLTRRQCRRGRP